MTPTGNKPSRTLAGSFNLWTSVSLAMATLLIVVLSGLISGVQLERELQRRCRQSALHVAIRLRDAVWNLDEQAISRFFSHYVFESDIVGIEVADQFGEVLYRWQNTTTPMPENQIAFRQQIFYKRETIGRVTVYMSRQRLNELRGTVFLWISATTLVGMASVAFTLRLLVGFHFKKPMDELVKGLNCIAVGEYDIALPHADSREIAEIQREVGKMTRQIAERTRQLEELRDQLEDLVAQRTKALETINRQLKAEVHKRRGAQRRLLTIAGLERRRIGRDLHDTLGQELAGAAYMASSLAEDISPENSEQAAVARRIAELIRRAATQSRRIARGMVGLEMSGDSLISELQRLTADATELHGLDCLFEAKGKELEVDDPEAGMYIYRIVQEAIHNAVRHGKAKRVIVGLLVDNASIELSIVDDGDGIPPEGERKTGLGLTTMSFRAGMLGGSFKADRRPQGGTEIVVRLPNPPTLEGAG